MGFLGFAEREKKEARVLKLIRWRRENKEPSKPGRHAISTDQWSKGGPATHTRFLGKRPPSHSCLHKKRTDDKMFFSLWDKVGTGIQRVWHNACNAYVVKQWSLAGEHIGHGRDCLPRTSSLISPGNCPSSSTNFISGNFIVLCRLILLETVDWSKGEGLSQASLTRILPRGFNKI